MNDLWIGFCHFHLGEYKAALEEYEKIVEKQILKPDNIEQIVRGDIWSYISCCQFLLGMYNEAHASLSRMTNKSALLNRLQFHLAHKFTDEKTLMQHHQQLQDVLEDQLCLASIHYLRSHYQEAIDIYKKILLDHRSFLALNVYVALCYYKLDYYDVSQEVLAVYLQNHPDSVTAVNLKACNHYRLYNGKAAEVVVADNNLLCLLSY